MKLLSLPFALAVLLTASAPASAQLRFLVETFEPSAGWTWGLPTSTVDSGGSPGAYLTTPGILDSALPKLQTGTGVVSGFTGDYRARGVRGAGVKLRIDAVLTPQGRSLSLELTNDGGTPSDVDDDCSAYFVGAENIPLPGEGWKPYVFTIDSQSEGLPAGWNLLSVAGNTCPGLTADEAWNRVITDVSILKFSYGDPSFFYIFQQWEGLSVDQPTLGFE